MSSENIWSKSEICGKTHLSNEKVSEEVLINVFVMFRKTHYTNEGNRKLCIIIER